MEAVNAVLLPASSRIALQDASCVEGAVFSVLWSWALTSFPSFGYCRNLP